MSEGTSVSTVRDFLQQTSDLLDYASVAERKGDISLAIDHYLDAAQTLFLTAKLSKGRLKQVRVQNAEKILETVDLLSSKRLTIKRSEASPNFNKGLEILEEMGIPSYGKTGVSFDDVGGLEEVKQEVHSRVIAPMKNPELAKKYNVNPGGGILMYGPPGTGKTHIVKALANEVEAFLISIKASELVDQWFGNFEKNIAKLFEAVRLCSPTVLFLDEVDALATRRRSSSSSVMKRAVAQLLQEMSDIGDAPDRNILVVAATNNPWDLDEAVLRPGRFDEKIYVPPPDWDARRRIFEIHLGKYYLKNIDFDECAYLTEGFSGADIKSVCDKAGRYVFIEAVNTGVDRPVEMEDIRRSIDNTPFSITEKMLGQYERFRNELYRR